MLTEERVDFAASENDPFRSVYILEFNVINY